MRRRQGALVANEKAMLHLLADVFPSWVTTLDLARMVRDRVEAGRWPATWTGGTINDATVYRILVRFRDLGWVQANWWVPDDPWSKDRPERIVVLTDTGRAKATELAAAVTA